MSKKAEKKWWRVEAVKRVSYRHGVEIIALNDEPTSLDVDFVTGMISVGLLAELFGVAAEKVAKDVVRFRKTHGEDKKNKT